MVKKRLAYRISFYILMALTFVFILVGLQTFKYLERQIFDSAANRTTLQSRNLITQIDHIFENAALYTYQMSLNPDVRQYLREVENRDQIRTHEKYESVYNYLVDIKNSNALYLLAWVANEKANFYLDSNNIVPDEDYNVKVRPWYPFAMNSTKPALTEPYIEWITKKLVISTIFAIREQDEVIGFTVIDIHLDNLPRILDQIKIGDNDINFMVSETGDYLFHDDQSKVLTSNIKDLSDPLSLYSDEIFSGNESLIPIKYNNKPYYMRISKLDSVNWYVISLIDTDNIQKEMWRVMVLIIIVMVIGFFGIGLFILWHVNRETRPYKLLVSYAERIENGDYDQNIPEEYLAREDEMGQTCQSFQRVIDRFNKEHHELEDKLIDQSREIEKQYAHILENEKAVSLGHIVAGVAHEINTPLGISITLASHLEDIYKESEKKLQSGTMTKQDLMRHFKNLEESLPLLNNNLDRAAQLVKSFKKVAVDQFSESMQKFSLREVLDNVILSLKAEYKRKPIKFDIYCADDLMLEGEPGIYTQIFTNLVMNAIIHGLYDTMDGLITIRCDYYQHGELKIEVKDNGVGISRDIRQKIFEPFFTTGRNNGCSGLGMNIVMNLVSEKLGGIMDVESVVGEYTKFIIQVPLNTNVDATKS